MEMMHALTMTVGLPTEDSARAARWYGMRWRPTPDLRPPPPRGGGCARRRGTRAMRGGVSAGVGDRIITYRS